MKYKKSIHEWIINNNDQFLVNNTKNKTIQTCLTLTEESLLNRITTIYQSLLMNVNSE